MKLLIFLCFCFSLVGFSQASFNQLDAKGQKQGPWKGYYSDTQHLKYEGTFDQGKEVGLFTFYDNTKVKKVVATRDFNPNDNSAYTIFYNNTFKVSEGTVVNKLFDGVWKFYHLNSEQLMTLEHYKKGKLEGVRKVYYKSGEVAEEANYSNGKKQGSYKKYAENGVVLEEFQYKDDLFHGPALFRDPDGKITTKGHYKNGLSVGRWTYYENDILIRTENKELYRTQRASDAANPNPTAIKRKVKERKL